MTALTVVPPSVELRTRLREVLDDPTVRLVMADPGRPGSWLDEDGQETELPESAHRAATIVERSGGPIAGIEYEPSTAEQSQLVDLAAMSVGFALESVRLAAVAAREAAAARAAATQVLVAAEIARDGLRRSVEAGPERELAAVGELLKERPLPLEDIHAGLRRATAAVREVSRALAEESPPGASPLDSVEAER